MLLALRVENLLLIERAELELAPGLNVLTGETGAGKTVLAHAIDLLLGGRARANVVRPGAAEAYVEGVFALPPALRHERGELLPADADEVVLARRVGADGRTRALVNGRTATLADLRSLAERMLSFYGQHEHRKLTLAAAQLDVLDAFCGEPVARERVRCAQAHAEVRRLAAELDDLRRAAGERERELDLLEFELREIDDARPDVEEHRELLARRERLRHADALRQGAAEAHAALAGGDGIPGAGDQLARAAAALQQLAAADPGLGSLGDRLTALSLDAVDIAEGLARDADSYEADPAELEAIESRLALLERLMRKHGGTVEAVVEHAERCRARHERLSDVATATDRAEADLAAAEQALAAHVATLRTARVRAAPRLAKAVRERLRELAMEHAGFEVQLARRDPGPTGADAVELMIAPNPGVPAGPLRDIASGGELSRVMLALLGVANAGSDTTLVFDEIDAGIGGQTARAVGERLRALGKARQVICITHLPQIASLAARHFALDKDPSAAPTRTVVRQLDEGAVVGELVRMLGADGDDAAARRHARELRRAA